MTQETFRLLKEMDINAAETQILLRCAPLIAGVKVSNLLIIKKVQENDVRQLFEREALKYACVTLYRDRECSVMLLYRKRELGLYFTGTLNCRHCWIHSPRVLHPSGKNRDIFRMKWVCFWGIRQRMSRDL